MNTCTVFAVFFVSLVVVRCGDNNSEKPRNCSYCLFNSIQCCIEQGRCCLNKRSDESSRVLSENYYSSGRLRRSHDVGRKIASFKCEQSLCSKDDDCSNGQKCKLIKNKMCQPKPLSLPNPEFEDEPVERPEFKLSSGEEFANEIENENENDERRKRQAVQEQQIVQEHEFHSVKGTSCKDDNDCVNTWVCKDQELGCCH